MTPARALDDRRCCATAAGSDAPVRHRPRDLRLGRKLRRQGVRRAAHLVIVDSAALRRHEQHEIGLLLAEVVLDLIGGAARFGVRIGEASGRQVGGDAAAERDCEDEEQRGAGEHRFAVGDGESTEASEHEPPRS